MFSIAPVYGRAEKSWKKFIVFSGRAFVLNYYQYSSYLYAAGNRQKNENKRTR